MSRIVLDYQPKKFKRPFPNPYDPSKVYLSTCGLFLCEA